MKVIFYAFIIDFHHLSIVLSLTSPVGDHESSVVANAASFSTDEAMRLCYAVTL